jgi:hypothetical protein
MIIGLHQAAVMLRAQVPAPHQADSAVSSILQHPGDHRFELRDPCPFKEVHSK